MDEHRVASEVSALASRIEREVLETGARFRRQGIIIAVGAVVCAGVAAVREIWALVPICLVFGGGILALAFFAAKKNRPEVAAPVLAALREAPERITKIAHTVTSDSKEVFVSHWVTVRTADGHATVRASDWEELLAALAARSPGATIDRGPAE